MKRTTNYKALYNFVKKQQTKYDRHIVKLDDSLDMIKKEVATPVKTLHNRTQSCPPITEGNHNELKKRYPEEKIKSTCAKDKALQGNNFQGKSAQEKGSVVPCALKSLRKELQYSKTSGKTLKKCGSGPASSTQLFKFLSHRDLSHKDHYAKTRVEQQMKAYELKYQLRGVEYQTANLGIRQQILCELLTKGEGKMTSTCDLLGQCYRKASSTYSHNSQYYI